MAVAAPRRSIASFGALPSAGRIFILAVAAAALGAAVPALAQLRLDEPWWTFAVLAAGAAAVNLRGVTTGRHHRLDGALVFITAAALLLPPELVAFMGLAQHGVDGVRRRYPWFAQVFNVANSTLAGLAAWAVNDAFAATGSDARVGAAAVVAGVTVVLANQTLLALMVRLGNGRSLRSTRLLSRESLAVEFVPACLGIALMCLWRYNPWLAPVALAPMLLAQRTYAILGRLTESEERFGAMFESAAVGTALMELDGTIVSSNRALETMLGYDKDELSGRDYLELVARDDAAAEGHVFAELVRGDRAEYHVERRYVAKNAGSVFGNASVALVRDARDNPRYAIAMIENATERKELEEQLRQSQKMEAVGRLAGGIAHDFNNVLTAITGYGEIALMRVDQGLPVERADLEEIRKAADRAAALTAQLLAFSRKQMLQPRVLDANEVVSDIERMLRRLIGEHVTIATVLRPRLSAIKADLSQLQQVLVNLAVNARDAMPTGGRLTIETDELDVPPGATGPGGAPPGSYVTLVVSDTGVGIPPETLPRIFEPFFSTKGAKGTGLGLATVYGVVTQSGGFIDVESEVGAGTTYRICLPRVDEEVGQPELIAPQRHAAATAATVLVVEDEDVVRTMIREVLRAAGYEVLDAPHAREAVRIHELHRGRVDLLLTDVVMPDVNGVELARQLTAAAPGLRTLFMSGYTGYANESLAGEAFLQKPFTPSELTRKLREVLDRPLREEAA